MSLKDILPNDPIAEMAVLGACIRDSEALIHAQEILSPAAFYQPKNAFLFHIISDLSLQNISIDFVTIGEAIRQSGKTNLLDPLYPAECVQSVVSSANVEYHANIIADCFDRRKLIQNCQDLINRAQKDGIARELESEFFQFAIKEQSIKQKKGLRSIADCCDTAIEKIQDRIKRRIEGQAWCEFQTGISVWDYKTGGVDAGDLIVIAARPSEGKTILGFQIAEHIGKKYPVLYFSLEMDSWRFVERFTTGDANIYSREGAVIVLKLAHELSQRNIFLDDTPGNSIENIRWQSIRKKMELGKIGGIVIDYLTLLNTNKKLFGLREIVTYLSNQSKILAREIECPVFLLAQLNRNSEKEGREPTITDIRESGAVEQDADLIVLLHRDNNVKRGETGPRKLMVEKNRNGPTFHIDMIYSSAKRRFEDDDPPF